MPLLLQGNVLIIKAKSIWVALIAAGTFVRKGRKGEFSSFIGLWKAGEEMFSYITE